MLDIQPANNWRFTNKMDIKPSVGLKKCLFGEPERESVKSDLNQMLGEIQKADRLRWNYDFKRDEPLPGGRYKWESSNPTCVKLDIDNCNGSTCESLDRSSYESESDSSSPDSPNSSVSSPLVRRTLQGNSQVAASPSTQRVISEFFRQKKRSSPSTMGDETKVKKARSTTNSPTPRSLFNPISKPERRD